MKVTDSQLSLGLALSPGIGSQTISRILMRNALLGRTPDQFLKIGAEALMEDYKVPLAAAEAWVADRKQHLTKALDLEQKLDAKKVKICCPVDVHYPSGIEEMMTHPPGLLFLYGNQKLLNSPTFSVMSSRKSPLAAKDLVDQLAEAGVMNGETLVAGHDTPEYQRAAIVPLRWGAPRILVLDIGMFAALGDNLEEEPFRAARLWRYKFDPHTDLVVSAINPVWQTHKGANQNRDQLVGALAKRLDFVMIKAGGNMDKIAHRALKLNRPVRVSDLTLEYRPYRELGAEIIEG